MQNVNYLFNSLHARKVIMIFAHIKLIFITSLTFSKNSFRNTIRVSNSLDPDQTRSVGPDLGTNHLQRT